MDGRDEIVFGSMVIDDNGKGLSLRTRRCPAGLYWDTTDLNRGILRVIQGVVNGISMATADSKQGIYDLRGNQLATPRRGLNIIRQRDGRVRKVHIK